MHDRTISKLNLLNNIVIDSNMFIINKKMLSNGFMKDVINENGKTIKDINGTNIKFNNGVNMFIW